MKRSNISYRFFLAPWMAIVIGVSTLGCQYPGVDRLQGTWRLENAEGLAELMTGGPQSKEGLGGLLDSVIDTVLEQVEASMEVEFGRGGNLVTRAQFGGREAKKEGIWKVIRSTEQEVVVWFQLGQDDPAEIIVAIVDQDTIRMVPPNIAVLNKTFTFHRVQQ
jgi:hypothetical protein